MTRLPRCQWKIERSRVFPNAIAIATHINEDGKLQWSLLTVWQFVELWNAHSG